MKSPLAKGGLVLKNPTRDLKNLLVQRRKLRPVWSRNPSDTRIDRFEVIAPLSDAETRALAQALEPLPPQELAQELSRLRLLTRARGQAQMSLLVAAYMDRLAPWPGGVVRFCLAQAADNSPFFPVWAELKRELDFWAGDLLKMGEAVWS